MACCDFENVLLFVMAARLDRQTTHASLASCDTEEVLQQQDNSYLVVVEEAVD